MAEVSQTEAEGGESCAQDGNGAEDISQEDVSPICFSLCFIPVRLYSYSASQHCSAVSPRTLGGHDVCQGGQGWVADSSSFRPRKVKSRHQTPSYGASLLSAMPSRHRMRQKEVDELRRKQNRFGARVGGVLTSLTRRFHKLTSMIDPELAAEDRPISFGGERKDLEVPPGCWMNHP